MPAAHLSIIAPGLLAPKQDEGQASARYHLPGLRRLLARAAGSAIPVSGFEATVWHVFGGAPAAAKDLPIAAITRAADRGAVEDGWWMRADPVHLRADQHRLLLFDDALLQVSAAEAEALTQSVNALYDADQWHLEATTPARWHMRLEHDSAIQTVAPNAVLGLNIDSFLPRGPGARRWRGVMNDVQMLLHAHPINQARAAQNKPAINSLWLWGAGQLPKRVASPFTYIASDDPLVLGLALLSNTPCHAIPGDYAEWKDLRGMHENCLIVWKHGWKEALHDDAEGWSAALAHLDRAWMSPLAQALYRGGLASLTLYPGNGMQYRITPGRMRCFWRRRARGDELRA